MKTSKKASIPVLLTLLLIGFIGLNDYGVFLEDFSFRDLAKFHAGEEYEIINTTDYGFNIKKDEKIYGIPMAKMIKTIDENKDFKVLKSTLLIGIEDQEPIEWLEPGEKVQKIQDGKKPVYLTRDGLKGHILEDVLEPLKLVNLTTGAVLEDVRLSNENEKTLELKTGDSIRIKNLVEGKFIIIAEDEEEYLIEKDLVLVRGNKEEVTRVLSDRKSKAVIKKIMTEAHGHLGKPYIYGATGPNGFDCSGLTFAIYKNSANITLPRTAQAQAGAGVSVSLNELKEGDLLFYNTSGSGISHVGIYIGDNTMIHASTGSRAMIKANIHGSYFASRFVTARRIIN